MKYDEKFYQPEIVEGFYVEGMMKRTWAVLIDILVEIDKICKRHDLMWFADSGTLLGAVRHKGFIPWDDDIDIVLLRPDYEKLIYYMERELPEEYYLWRPDTETHDNVIRYTFWYSKVTKGYTLDYDMESLKRFHGCPYPVGVDVFPLDGVPDDLEERGMFINIFQYIQRIYMELEQKQEVPEEYITKIEKLCNFKFKDSEDLFWQLNSLGNKFCQLYPVEECNYVSPLWYRYWYKEGCADFEKAWYTSVCKKTFENIKVSCPIGYEYVLKLTYGENYMTPIKGMGLHEYPVYDRMHKALLEIELPETVERERIFAESMHVMPRELKEISVYLITEAATYYKYYFDGKFFINRIPKSLSPDYFAPMRERKLYQMLSDKNLIVIPTYLNNESGYKITPYIDNMHSLDIENADLKTKEMEVLKRFHSQIIFDEKECLGISPFDRICYWNKNSAVFGTILTSQKRMKKYFEIIEELAEILKDYPMHTGLAHMKLSWNKFLFECQENSLELKLAGIKYAGIGDIDWDFGTLAAGDFYEPEKILNLLECYYQDFLEANELISTYKKVLIYTVIASYERAVCYQLLSSSIKEYRRYSYQNFKYMIRILDLLGD